MLDAVGTGAPGGVVSPQLARPPPRQSTVNSRKQKPDCDGVEVDTKCVLRVYAHDCLSVCGFSFH